MDSRVVWFALLGNLLSLSLNFELSVRLDLRDFALDLALVSETRRVERSAFPTLPPPHIACALSPTCSSVMFLSVKTRKQRDLFERTLS